MRSVAFRYWLRRHGPGLLPDVALSAIVVWFVIWPPAGLWDGMVHAAAVTAVILRAWGAWWGWRHAPQRLNTIWHKLGREEATRRITKVARRYQLEPAEPVAPFEGELGEALLHARQDLAVPCGLVVPRAAIDVVADSVHGFWTPVDRSAALPSPGLRMAVGDPIPDAAGFSPSFANVWHVRARDLLAEDREIALFWSGGIDSTAALTALLMQAVPADRARLHVFLRPRSIDEYPEFYAEHVRHLPYEIIDGLDTDPPGQGPGHTFSSDAGPVLAREARRRLVVTGEHGDQIYGSIKLAENPEWIGQAPERLLADTAFDGHRDAITQLNAACPVPVRDIDTMLRWWNFAVKWQEITYRRLSDLEDASQLANIRHFFQTDDLQRWSIANPVLKIRDTIQSYKWPAKDFVHAFAGHADYRDHKLKVGSLRVRIGSILGIDDRRNIIRAGRTSTDKAKIRARHGDRLGRFIQDPTRAAA